MTKHTLKGCLKSSPCLVYSSLTTGFLHLLHVFILSQSLFNALLIIAAEIFSIFKQANTVVYLNIIVGKKVEMEREHTLV